MIIDRDVSLGFSRAEIDETVGRSLLPTLMLDAVGFTGVTGNERVTYHLKTTSFSCVS